MQRHGQSHEQAALLRPARTVIVAAHAEAYVPIIRDLFQEYARSLQVDLCFQNFTQELADLPGKYAPPSGRLFLATQDHQPLGCVAVRQLSDSICEMKRLYVRPDARGLGLGRKLAQKAIAAGSDVGYQRMRLDTLGSMKEAIALYESLGFQPIKPYYKNPSPCAVFMELVLPQVRSPGFSRPSEAGVPTASQGVSPSNHHLSARRSKATTNTKNRPSPQPSPIRWERENRPQPAEAPRPRIKQGRKPVPRVA
jgi:ribosomal protein S18 acetylase RimI-like enzyme